MVSKGLFMSFKLETPIYPDEKDIEGQILKCSIISSLAQLSVAAPFSLSTNLEKLIASERKSVDLHYLHSVLVSSVWNDNDELFLPSELWYSRNTPKDKQFNFEHSEDDIIGHMTNSHVISEDGSRISDNTNPNDLPDVIHIFNQAVLYKHWENKDKQERMDKIIEELADNIWFVSVECLLPDFDYALKDKKGNIELVSRNKKTSFLTKYLRLFGGEGLYDGKRIARVPRNFIISGKGLVKQPANKSSVILAKKIDFAKIEQSIKEFTPNNVIEVKIIDNPEFIQELKTHIDTEIGKISNLKDNLDLVYSSNDPPNKKVIKMDNVKELEYQSEIKKLSDNFQKLQASISEVEVNKVKTQLTDALKDLESKNQEINVLKASVETVHAEKVTAAKTIEEITKLKDSLQKQLDDINLSVKNTKRLEAAKSIGLADDKAQIFIEQTDKMTDEAFDKHIEFQKSFMSINSKNTVTETVVEISKEEVEKSKNKIEASLVVTAGDKKADVEKFKTQVATYLNKGRAYQGGPKFQEKVSK